MGVLGFEDFKVSGVQFSSSPFTPNPQYLTPNPKPHLLRLLLQGPLLLVASLNLLHCQVKVLPRHGELALDLDWFRV